MCGGEQQQGGGEEAAAEAGQDHRGGAQQVGHQHAGEPADTLHCYIISQGLHTNNSSLRAAGRYQYQD